MRIGIGSDWTGGATHKYIIMDETLSGKYVLRDMPIEIMRWDGSTYLAEPNTGLFLRDKSKIMEVKE